MAASLRSMKKYLNLVEARVKDAEDILTQMPPGGQGPSPRVLKQLEDAEEALKAQYKRMNDDTLEAVADKVEDAIDRSLWTKPNQRLHSSAQPFRKTPQL